MYYYYYNTVLCNEWTHWFYQILENGTMRIEGCPLRRPVGEAECGQLCFSPHLPPSLSSSWRNQVEIDTKGGESKLAKEVSYFAQTLDLLETYLKSLQSRDWGNIQYFQCWSACLLCVEDNEGIYSEPAAILHFSSLLLHQCR